MAPARDDVRLLVFAAGAVLLAGVAVAVLLLVSTDRGSGPPLDPGPVRFGFEANVREQLEEGPFFVPDQFGGDLSFWIAEEDGEIVAIATHQDDLPDCTVKWKAQFDRFECGDERYRSSELERYQVSIPETGDDENVVTIDVRRRLPAPALSAG
ncbi:MAG TPA: hypothetical protein VF152_15555 [Acidimicrobiia bacterium]